MAAESVQLNAWLYDLLSADALLAASLATLAATVYDGNPPAVTWGTQWWPGAAPGGSPRVYGLWQWIATPDATGMGATRLQVQPRLRVYVVAASANWEALSPAADRLDALLQGLSAGGTAAVAVDACWRLSEYSRLEDVSGVRWLSLGGLYAVFARSL